MVKILKKLEGLLIMQKIIDYVRQIDPNFQTNHHWYAGISNDPDRRKSEHEREKGITCKHFKYWRCSDEEVARNIEKKLEEHGFSIHADDLKPAKIATSLQESFAEKVESNFVYVYKAVKK